MRFSRFFPVNTLIFILAALFSGCQVPPALSAFVPRNVQTLFDQNQSGQTSPTPFQPMPTPEATATLEPTLTPTPVGCTETQGQVETLELDSDLLSQPLQVKVYLPPCYGEGEQEGESYPLLVMIHGQTFNYDQWVRLGLIDAADRLISSGEIPPMIIAMPNERDTFSNPWSSSWGKALVDDMLPWLEQQYGACAQPSCRAIGGLSRGGAWALHIAFTRPGVFGAVGAHSVPPFTGDGPSLPLWLRSFSDGELPRVYMDIGDRDNWRPYAVEFKDLLDYYKVPYEWHDNSGKHEEAYWSAHVEEYLRWYAQGWPQP